MNITKNLGMLMLAIYLILVGIMALVHVAIPVIVTGLLALAAGIFNFNCESEPELALIDALAHRRGVKARVALRVNPDVETDTHHYISTGKLAHKFGVDIAEAEGIYERARKLENLLLEGVSCHIGSLLLDPGPLMEAVDRVLALIERLRAKGFDIRHADLGGGLGVAYKPDEVTPSIETFVCGLKRRLEGAARS